MSGLLEGGVGVVGDGGYEDSFLGFLEEVRECVDEWFCGRGVGGVDVVLRYDLYRCRLSGLRVFVIWVSLEMDGV